MDEEWLRVGGDVITPNGVQRVTSISANMLLVGTEDWYGYMFTWPRAALRQVTDSERRGELLVSGGRVAVHECVQRRDGTHVWRWVNPDTETPQVTGGRRFIHSLDAAEFTPGTRIRVREPYTITLVHGGYAALNDVDVERDVIRGES